MFADDVLLFAKARVSQAKVIKKVRDVFCSMFGLKISVEKSKLYASGGVPRKKKDHLSQVSRMRFTTNLGKYLGFKLFHGRVRKHDFSEVIDRVSSKLASWKGRLLNKPGRLTLANAVLSSIPTYGMQVQWFPQSVCNLIDRTVNNFLWKGNKDKGMNMVGWNTITKLRRLGGLGVRIARKHIVALLGKLVWDIINSPNKLWVSLLLDKY